MNLIDRIKELQKLEVKDVPGTFATEFPEYEYIVTVLNTAPELLSIMGEIRPGDADEIDYAIQELSRIFGPDDMAETIEVLRRYQAMAEHMETSK